MQLGTMLMMPGDPVTSGGLIERAVEAEEAGLASVWLPQVTTVDALMTLALAGQATSSVELGTAVVPTYPRHPAVMAQQALSVQDATDNRLALGVGLSHKFFIENSMGLDYSKPIPHTRDYLTILNGLLTGEYVKHQGDAYNVKAQVEVAGTKKPPVLVAALGPQMLRLCGRLSDGTITWMGGIDYLRDIAVPTMTDAAQEAGRDAPRFVAMVPVLLTNDVDDGRETVNETFKAYGQIPSYRATLDRGGAANPADVAIVGDDAAVAAGIAAYAEVGVTDFAAVIPPGTATTDATKELLGALVAES